MPKNLRHGQQIEATLAVIASNHVESTETILLWTERLEVRPKRVARKSTLFEPIGYDHGSLVAARIQRRAILDSEIGMSTPGEGYEPPPSERLH
jgi:hypothetical protein